jgi:epoxyqueuosine reductase QueG
MDRERMLTVPYEPSRLAVMDAYVDVGRVAIDLATRIRAMGWDACAETNLDVNSSSVVHVPVAIDAGLGQLGKHGSMITQAYGSNVRLATVLTRLC